MASASIFFFCLCLLCVTTVVHSRTLASDIAALQALKASINPNSIPPSSCLATWNFSAADPCSPFRRDHFACGLSCSASADRVTAVTLDSVGYSGTLSPLVSRLTQLALLDLSENHFSGPIPNLTPLSNLNSLTLRSNSFTGNLPPDITNLKSLETLDVSHNSLSGYLPKALNLLTKLRRLDVSFNRFVGSLPKLPANLLVLAAKGNSLSGPLPESAFSGSTELRVIELGANSFSGAVPGWFFLQPSLQQVDLANNSLTAAEIWAPVRGNRELVAVDLGFNRIGGFAPVNFSGFSRLSSLSLRYNRLRGRIPPEYAARPSLKRLFLDGNYLSGMPPSRLFSGAVVVSGSVGYNCLRFCPTSSELCSPPQKPPSLCRSTT